MQVDVRDVIAELRRELGTSTYTLDRAVKAVLRTAEEAKQRKLKAEMQELINAR